MFRGGHILDPNQIVEPGASDHADFDREAYHKAMREGRSEGLFGFIVAFLVGGLLGVTFAADYPLQARLAIGVGLGAVFVFGVYRIRASKRERLEAEAVDLHAQAHALQVEARQLEVEAAKASGAFSRWDKS